MGAFTELVEAALLVLVLTLLCRWVFGNKGIRYVAPRPDYGLLTPVLRTDTEEQAQQAHAALDRGGIRATVAPAGLGFTANGHQWPADARVVLVFAADEPAATTLLRRTAGSR